LFWLVIYAIVLAASGFALLVVPMGSPLGFLIIISPVIPVAFVLGSIMQLLQNTDELQQRIQLLSIVFSAVATGLLTFAYGLLERLGYPHFDTGFILPLMVILWIIGMLYFKWRFR
jgi:hypothetical protein